MWKTSSGKIILLYRTKNDPTGHPDALGLNNSEKTVTTWWKPLSLPTKNSESKPSLNRNCVENEKTQLFIAGSVLHDLVTISGSTPCSLSLFFRLCPFLNDGVVSWWPFLDRHRRTFGFVSRLIDFVVFGCV